MNRMPGGGIQSHAMSMQTRQHPILACSISVDLRTTFSTAGGMADSGEPPLGTEFIPPASTSKTLMIPTWWRPGGGF